VACPDLLRQQIAREVRMAVRELRVVVDPAVVTSAEESHAVDMRGFQGMCEEFRVELGADPWNVLTGMEIEMDLAKTEFLHDVVSRQRCR
jgi:hypothetical protein